MDKTTNKILTTRFFESWWRRVQAWFVMTLATKKDLESINIDTTELAKQGDNADATLTYISEQVGDVSSLFDEINGENIPVDFVSDYAKQGDNPNATMTELLDSINAISPDVVQGKERLATAITNKGVQTASTDSISQMADNVLQISQDTYILDGGEMYSKQLYGSLETPNYWNLYEVLQDLLSDGRFVNYGGILLAEYYKGYDGLALSGAGAGGGYMTSDGAYYTEDLVHTWNDDLDGKGNRWVAYLFATEYHDFEITDTNTSPRSIFIGRKVGAIRSLANGRISQIVVPDGNELKNFDTQSYTQNYGQKLILRNAGDLTGRLLYGVHNNVESIYIQCKSISYGNKFIDFTHNGRLNNVNSLIIKADRIGATTFAECLGSGLKYIDIYGVIINITYLITGNITYSPSIIRFTAEELSMYALMLYSDLTNTKLYFNYITNDKSKSVRISNNINTLQDVILQDGWNKPLNIANATALTEVNMYAHILQRLKQDEPLCGSGVTITLGATNLEKLTSAESVALLDSLTNIYGYTFA